jgi:hypothetical protein
MIALPSRYHVSRGSHVSDWGPCRQAVSLGGVRDMVWCIVGARSDNTELYYLGRDKLYFTGNRRLAALRSADHEFEG